MLYPQKTIAALLEQRAAFRSAQETAREQQAALAATLSWLEALEQDDIVAVVGETAWPGALPTEEQNRRPPVIPFPHDWECHMAARAWARDILDGVTTFAADGSQISLGTSACSISVGVVQIGWFENRHREGGDFVKDVRVEILTPDELRGEGRFGDQEVEWRRFRGEVDAAVAFMRAHQGDERALAFFDGPLVLPFLRDLEPALQQRYIDAVEWLIDVSEQARVPLVGYVEPSAARDLATLVALAAGRTLPGGVTDAGLLAPRLRAWGARSRLFQCARNVGTAIRGIEYLRRVQFAYLKTTVEGNPTRVEMPEWILASGRADWVFDVVRAECVIGLGYPYALETADATAVLTGRDREHFLGLFQRFAEREGLPLRISKKANSKRGRRA